MPETVNESEIAVNSRENAVKAENVPLWKSLAPRILELREKGMRYEEIAAELNISKGLITKALRGMIATAGTRILTREQIQNSIYQFAPKAIQKIQTLAESGRKEDTQLRASQDILDRAGFSAVQKTLLMGSLQIETMNADELNEQASAILKEAIAAGVIANVQ